MMNGECGAMREIAGALHIQWGVLISGERHTGGHAPQNSLPRPLARVDKLHLPVQHGELQYL